METLAVTQIHALIVVIQPAEELKKGSGQSTATIALLQNLATFTMVAFAAIAKNGISPIESDFLGQYCI